MKKIVFLLCVIAVVVVAGLFFRKRWWLEKSFPVLPPAQIRPPETPVLQPPASQVESSLYRAGDYSESIAVDGQKRTYVLHVPTGYVVSNRYPLVAVFHGGGGEGKKIASQTGFPPKADQEGFIAVFPDGINQHWDDGRDVIIPPVNDVKFVRTLIEHLKTKLSIDQNKIYAVGVSNGGILSHRLGCEMADVFAAIGADVGSLATNMVSRCNPQNSIAVAVIQGTKDPFVPIGGGKVSIGIGGFVESAESSMQWWASKNGCQSAPIVTNLPPHISDGTSVTKKHYAQCRDHAEVTYYLVNGMGHLWPPKSQVTRGAAGPPSQNIDATAVFWEFFKAHPKK